MNTGNHQVGSICGISNIHLVFNAKINQALHLTHTDTLIMHKPKKKKSCSPPQEANWLKYLNDCDPLVIPIGSRFQVDVPEWRDPPHNDPDPDSSKWLGTRIWPLENEEDRNTAKKGEKEGVKIGEVRSGSCSCSSPGSQHCMKRHISEERARLEAELGPAYRAWKFDEMGDIVAKSWSSKQEKRFESFVKDNPLSKGDGFLKPAMLSFKKSKSREDIVSYYLNVYIPRRISRITKSGGKVPISDDEEAEVEANSKSKSSAKRPRAHESSNESAKIPKCHYLTGRR